MEKYRPYFLVCQQVLGIFLPKIRENETRPFPGRVSMLFSVLSAVQKPHPGVEIAREGDPEKIR